MNKLVSLAALAAFASLSSSSLAQEPKGLLQWTDYTNNPIELNSPGERAYVPSVLYNESWPADSRFRIWYDIASAAGIAYSSSGDGINWSGGVAVNGLNTITNDQGRFTGGRPVVLFNAGWPKPYRLYYHASPTNVWQIRVAESNDGITFTNDQVALKGGRLGNDPDPVGVQPGEGHGVAYIPGRNVDPGNPDTAQPFILYFRDKDSLGIAYANSQDGYTFTEAQDNPDTTDVDEGLIRITGLPADISTFVAKPNQILQVTTNDFRMFAYEELTNFKYLVSPNGIDWSLVEDPVAVIGSVGPTEAWNETRNFYASAAYLGDGRFVLYRAGLSGSGVYRTGVAFGESAFYKANDIGKWSFYSPFNDFTAEGWQPFSSTGNDIDGTLTATIQNPDGTVSVRDRRETGNFYLVHDTSWAVPYTFEFRAKLDDATTTGVGVDAYPKYTFSAFQQDALNPGGEAWQPAFAQNRFGQWNLGDESVATAIWTNIDNTQFQTYTVVCRFDESARTQLAIDPGNGAANINLCVFDVYLNRDFSTPKASFHNTGFFGWPEVDADGRLDIGFPGPSAGQVTVDWVRWGNGVILDLHDPGDAVGPVLTIARVPEGVTVNWSGGGVLQSTGVISGPWKDEPAIASGSKIPTIDAQKFYRVRL